MIKIITSKSRHYFENEWLKTYWLFSFSDYYDPDNLDFGKLKAFNDDIIAPNSGFGSHYHDNMEIITIVHEGILTHKDNLGNSGNIEKDQVQRMSAGKGIMHSEYNGEDKPVHLYQVWISPDKDKHNLEPSYEQRTYPISFLKNKLLAIASGQDLKDTLKIHSDSTIYVGEFERSKQLELTDLPDRNIFIYLKDGEMTVNGKIMKKNDQARISSEKDLILIFKKKTFFTLIDVPSGD